jgi:hypothetical protein
MAMLEPDLRKEQSCGSPVHSFYTGVDPNPLLQNPGTIWSLFDQWTSEDHLWPIADILKRRCSEINDCQARPFVRSLRPSPDFTPVWGDEGYFTSR